VRIRKKKGTCGYVCAVGSLMSKATFFFAHKCQKIESYFLE